jgi:HAD superfamily hydrolase (TIGR01549 family)
MDGTLLNSGDFGVRAIRMAFEQMLAEGKLPGLSAPPADESIRRQIGKRPHEFYRDLLPADLQHLAQELHGHAVTHERAFLRDATGKLFDGAREVLVELAGRGLKLLLISNCTPEYMDAVVETFDLAPLLDFQSPVGRDPALTKSIELARGLRELGASSAVMVGDRVHDAEAARNNGAWFIACTYGYGTAEEFTGAHASIDDIRKLPALLA